MKSIFLLTVLAILAVKTTSKATINIDDGMSHTFDDHTYENDLVCLDKIIANSPGTHVDLVDGGLVDTLYLYNTSSLTMTGGSIGSLLRGWQNSTIDISGGSINDFFALDNSTVTMSGGSVQDELAAGFNSTITMSGGSFGKIRAYYDGTIYLVGSGFEADGQPLSYGDKLSDFGTFYSSIPYGLGYLQNYYTGTITGTLANGSYLNDTFYVAASGTSDIFVVPEPVPITITDVDIDPILPTESDSIMTNTFIDFDLIAYPQMVFNNSDFEQSGMSLQLDLYFYEDGMGMGTPIVSPLLEPIGMLTEGFYDLTVRAYVSPNPIVLVLPELSDEYFTSFQVITQPIPVEMVVIPGGEFEMGDHHGDGYTNELPLHAVLVDSFFMSKYEITNHQFCDFLNNADVKVDGGIVYASSDGSNSYRYCSIHSYHIFSQIDYLDGVFSVITKGGRDMSYDPMVEVNWYGAVAYCNWRSNEEGKETCYNLSTWECDFSKNGYRLATEAEWEYAARGAEQSPYYRFPWGDTISHSHANYNSYWSGGVPYYPYNVNPTFGYHPDWSDVLPYTSVVGSFSSNDYGLYDMAGNVWEWCNDWYDENYYDVSPYNNPTGPVNGIHRVLRSGGWDYGSRYCRVAARSYNYPYGRRSGLYGFRIVRDSESTNSPPVANAGDDRIVYICTDGTAQIELDGSGSTDADGDELEYLWTWEIEGTPFDANGVSPIIELPVGLHTIELTVDDGVEVSEPNSCVIEVIEGIEVDLRVMPRVINRKSRMRRILAVVQLPAGIDGDDIDGSFWLYPGEIEPRFHRLMTVNGSQKLFMVFDKSELMAAVPGNGAVVLEIEAQLISGRCLYGSDRIRIIRRGRGPKEQTGLRKGTRFGRTRVQNSR